MKAKEYFDNGYDHGYNIASWIDLPEIGEELPVDVDWQGIDRIENLQDAQEAFMMLCGNAEEDSRQFTPFEFTAHEIDSLPEFDSDEAWEAFDNGIYKGFEDSWNERKDYYYDRED